ncbi:MAG TPA: isocitrate lyase/phosphoenolpyruvate mutase family protein [Solimonas sp.]|nr:isocitrate lyase/phosphoenolpyruvate mutase family protein [Solimonas sp.]
MSAPSQQEKAARFQALHRRGDAFLMPNPFDGGSARLFERLGFECLATSSGASAATLGKRDGQLSREQVLAHLRLVCEATMLPVSADLENGFGEAPAQVAETIGLAAGAGAVGGSIEDYTGDAAQPIYDLELATRRIAAAAEAARALTLPFTLTARCENFLRDRPDLDDTIARLQAYERAGAGVLFAPALPDLDAVRRVAQSLKNPLSFMVGIPGKSFSVAELAAAGVRRISVGGSMYQLAMKAVGRAATQMKEQGSFGWLDQG